MGPPLLPHGHAEPCFTPGKLRHVVPSCTVLGSGITAEPSAPIGCPWSPRENWGCVCVGGVWLCCCYQCGAGVQEGICVPRDPRSPWAQRGGRKPAQPGDFPGMALLQGWGPRTPLRGGAAGCFGDHGVVLRLWGGLRSCGGLGPQEKEFLWAVGCSGSGTAGRGHRAALWHPLHCSQRADPDPGALLREGH